MLLGQIRCILLAMTTILCQSQSRSSGLACAWTHNGVGVDPVHAQLYRFYLESPLASHVMSQNVPSSHFSARNIETLGGEPGHKVS